MFQNNNNAVIKQLSKISLKTSKLRNRLAGVVIALSAFLLVLVSTFAYNAIMELKNLTHYQALFENADIQVLDSLKRNPEVEVYGLSQQVGIVKSGDTSLSLLYADEKTMELSNVLIKTGLPPVKANEISVEKGYIDSVYPGVQIGDTINLTYRNEVSREMKMDSFIITSFLETGAKNDKRRKAYNAIVSQAFIESDLALSSVYPSVIIKVTNAEKYSNSDLKAKVKEIGNLAGLPDKSININNANIDSNNASSETVATVFAVLLVVVTACSLVIYNIFYITIIRKVNEYGQLRTVGTTKRQLKKIVMGEGKLLCFRYIPIGILLGCGLSYLLRPSMYLVMPSFILALCGGCITFITVMLALRKPAKIAAEVSPMEAVRYTGFYGVLRGKKNIARKVTPYTLGKMYYLGNKKKTAVTFQSLAFSGILFIAAASLISSADPVKRAAQRFPYGGEYIIQLNNNLLSPTTSYSDLQIDNPLSDELKAKMTAINGVDSVEIHKYIRGKLVGINHDDEMLGIDNIRKNDVSKFEKYLIQGTLPNSSGKEILVNCSTSTYKYFGHIYQPGDIIMMYLFDGDTQITKEFTVSGVIDNKHSSDTLFLPDSVIDELMIQNCNLSFEIISHQGYSANIEILLKALITSDEKLEFISMKEQTELYRSAFYMLNVIVYTFIALIGCFSMVNLINTIITNIVSRKNELSIMQAVGMSKSQLMKMLNTENGYLILGSFIVSIILGSTLGYFICKAAGNTGGFSYIQYRFPFWIIVTYFLFIITLQGITIGCIGIGMRKNSLIERLSEI